MTAANPNKAHFAFLGPKICRYEFRLRRFPYTIRPKERYESGTTMSMPHWVGDGGKAFRSIKDLLKANTEHRVFMDYSPILVVIVLFLATFMTLPRVDYVESSPLFYFEHLPLLYHLSVAASALAAITGRNRYTRIFSVIAFALLLEFTPSAMFVNPWHCDAYGFTAQAVQVARDGYIGSLKDLQESPSLALTFGALQLLTGIDPLLMFKIYQLVVVTILALMLYSIAERIVGDNGNAAIASLSFFAILWPVTFFFNRQNFSLIFYLGSLLLLSNTLLDKRDKRIFGLLGIQIFLMILSHPATPLFFVGNLVAVTILAGLSKRLSLREVKDLIYFTLFTFLVWLIWHNYFVPGRSGLLTIFDTIDNLLNSLRTDPTEIFETSKIFPIFTPIYSFIVRIRLILCFLPAVLVLPMLFLVYWYRKNAKLSKISIILISWLLSNLSSAVPLLYAGLPYFYRPALFTFISWGPSAAFIYMTIQGINSSRIERSLNWKRIGIFLRFSFVILLILLPGLMLPVVKYSPLPYLYPTSRELATKMSLDTYQKRGSSAIYMEFNIPWLYTYILTGANESNVRLLGQVGENIIDRLRSETLFVTDRLITRDAFYLSNPSMNELIVNVSEFAKMTHNKVYDAGGFNWILQPSR